MGNSLAKVLFNMRRSKLYSKRESLAAAGIAISREIQLIYQSQ